MHPVQLTAVHPPATVGFFARRRIHLSRHLLPWLLPFVLLIVWQWSIVQQWIPTQILPAPKDVWLALCDLASSGDLWYHTLLSLQRVLLGFALGTIIGLIFGVSMGVMPRLAEYILPSFTCLVQIPVLGWFPFALLIFGLGEPLKYVLIAHAALVPVTFGMLQVFRQAPVGLIEVARVNGYTSRQIISSVILPAAIPTLFSALRLGFTKAWLSLIVVELLASSEGLGYLVVYGRQLFQLDLVLAAVAVIGLLGYAIDRVFTLSEKRLLKYRQSQPGDTL